MSVHSGRSRPVRAWLLACTLPFACVLAPSGARAQLSGADPSCSGGAQAERCYRLGLDRAGAAVTQSMGPGGSRDALPLLLGACGGGVGDGCYIAARLTEADPTDNDSIRALLADRALGLFTLGCNAQPRPSGAACTAVGFYYADRPRAAYLDSALHYLERACAQDEPAACYRGAELMDDWITTDAPRSREAVRRIQAACAAGSSGACLSAAAREEQRLARTPPARRGTAAYRRDRDAVRRAYADLCAKKILAGCTALGTLHAEGRLGLPVVPDSARRYLEPACTGEKELQVVGHGPACGQLGRLFAAIPPAPRDTLPRADAPVDTARAVRYLHAGCALLDPVSCADLAVHGYRLKALPGAVAFFRAQLACREGSGYACRAAGLLGRQGLADDPQQAERYLRQACILDDGAGCRALALAQDAHLDSARKYLRRACALGDGAGCRMFAQRQAREGMAQENVAALMVRACAQNDAEACWHVMVNARAKEDEVAEGEYRTRACRLDPQYCKRAGD